MTKCLQSPRHSSQKTSLLMKTLITAKSFSLHWSCATLCLCFPLSLSLSRSLLLSLARTIRWRNERSPLAILRHYDNWVLRASWIVGESEQEGTAAHTPLYTPVLTPSRFRSLACTSMVNQITQGKTWHSSRWTSALTKWCAWVFHQWMDSNIPTGMHNHPIQSLCVQVFCSCTALFFNLCPRAFRSEGH